MDITVVRERLAHLTFIMHVKEEVDMDDVTIVGFERAQIYRERCPMATDVHIENGHEWTFEEMRQVAEALGVADIDAAPLWEWEDLIGRPLVRTDGACDTCGHGDAIIVRGVLTPRVATSTPTAG